MTRVAVVAPSPVIQAGLEALLAERAGLVLVATTRLPGADGLRGEDDDGVAALDAVRAAEPDVVLWSVERGQTRAALATLGRVTPARPLDGARPSWADGFPSSGGEGARALGFAVVLLADPAEPAPWVAAALRAGVRAVLPTTVSGDQLAAALEAAACGLVTLPPAALAAVLASGEDDGDTDEGDAREAPRGDDVSLDGRTWLAAAARPGEPRDVRDPRMRTPAGAGALAVRTRPDGGGGAPSLSPREREVLVLLAEGLANKVIAPRLGISEHTVKAHVAAIFEKLGVGTRAEAVVTAARLGLLLL